MAPTFFDSIRETNIFKRPKMHQGLDITKVLEIEGAVLYGSKALGVDNDFSDYDVAFSYETHIDFHRYLLNVIEIPPIGDLSYFSSIPEGGYHSLFRYHGANGKIDILFVRNNEDLDVIRSSVQDIQSIPSYMLEDKKFRIEAYNRALQHRGWKPASHTENWDRDTEVGRAIIPDFIRQQAELERGTISRLDLERALLQAADTNVSIGSSRIFR